MSWSFTDSVVFAAIMALRDMSREENSKLIKTQKYYQECYNRIAVDVRKALEGVSKVVLKASRRNIPIEMASGNAYLVLYAYALVIEKQGGVNSEQSKIIKLYFDRVNLPFSQRDYLIAAQTGAEIGDFRKVISITKNYAGIFWVHFFRALYKSGTPKDLQDVVDSVTSIIMRFSVIGNPNSLISESICRDFVESVNYQIDKAGEISMNEVDWLGMIPISRRLREMKANYESLIDKSDITEDMSKDDLLPLLELMILNSICDIVMMINQPKSIKIQMINDSAALAGINTDFTPEQYVKEIANNTEMGMYFKELFAVGPPLGHIWEMIFYMGRQSNQVDKAMALTYSLLSILLQIENHLDEKYHFLGEEESIAKNYILHITGQLLGNRS